MPDLVGLSGYSRRRRVSPVWLTATYLSIKLGHEALSSHHVMLQGDVDCWESTQVSPSNQHSTGLADELDTSTYLSAILVY